MFEIQCKNIPENGSFARKTFIFPTPSGDKQTKIDAFTGRPRSRIITWLKNKLKMKK